MKLKTTEVRTATGPVQQVKMLGAVRGQCPCCGSDVIANRSTATFELGFECVRSVNAEGCDYRKPAPSNAACRPARLPDGRRYWMPVRRALRSEGLTAARAA